MRRTWKSLLVGACVVSFVLLLGVFNATKPRILILQSASADAPWVSEMDRGMRTALRANRRPIGVEWMYMDVSAPTASLRVGQAQAAARRAIARMKPDVLIAVDDEANLLVARDYVGRSEPRILYVSLNRPPVDYGYQGAPNVTGISEHLPFSAVRDAVSALFPSHKPGVSIIGVDSVTGRAEMAQARSFDWGPLNVDAAQLVTSAAAWRGFVDSAKASDVLVVLSCHDLPDANGAVFTAPEASRWTQEHAKPLPIGLQVDFVPNGGALSFSPPPADNGAKAIQLALDWLDERVTPGAPQPTDSSHFEVAVRQQALVARGITLPAIYIEAARENETLRD